MQANLVPDWRGLLEESIRYERGGELDRALKGYRDIADGAADPALVSEALRRQSDVFRMRAQWHAAIAAAQQSAGIAEQANLHELRADALNTEASTHFYLGDFDVALPLLRKVLALSADKRVRGAALQNVGAILARGGDLENAAHHFLESYRNYRRAGMLRGQVLALQNYGAVALDREDYDRACKIMRKAVAAARKVHDLDLLAMTNVNYAEALAGRQEYAQAAECLSTAVGYFTIAGNKLWRVKCLRLLGDLHVKQDDVAVARRCYERGLQLAKEIEARVDEQRIAERLQRLDEPK
jgi:tetratricopeptide (TPR) repeat protein